MKSDTKIGIFVVLVLVAVVVVLLGREVMNRKQADVEGEALAEAAPLPEEGTEGTDVVAEAIKDDVSGQPAAPGAEVVVVPDEMGTGVTPAPAVPGAPAAPVHADVAAPAAPQDYVVQSGDTLEKISKAVYGKKSLWKNIAEANPGVNPSNLKIGAKLVIPPAPASAPSASPATTMDAGTMTAYAGGKTYTIRPGDTLEKISKEVYGRKSQWKAIAEANPGVNPSRLKVGAVLSIPEAPVASASPAPSASPAAREPWKTPGSTKLVTSPRG